VLGGFKSLLILTQEISLHTLHPFASLRAGSNSLLLGERRLHEFPLPLFAEGGSASGGMGGDRGEGDPYGCIRMMSIYLIRLL